MALAREFRETVKASAESDPAFREALLVVAVGLLLESDVDTGEAVLPNYIDATTGFEGLAAEVGSPSKSLMRMFSTKGNPKADNLFSVIKYLQKATGSIWWLGSARSLHWDIGYSLSIV